MSIASQNALRKTAPDSERPCEPSLEEKIPENDFRELLKTPPVSEETSDKDFFAFIAEEEEEEESENKEAMIVAAALHSASCSASLSHFELASVHGTAVVKAGEISAEIEACFEKMASCMIVMSSSHEIETTFFLDHPEFSSSSLFGTQVIIREFSTAPKAFNVEILANAHAAAVIDAGKSSLLSKFEKGNFNFSIHRLDTHLQQGEDRPVLHRKEDLAREDSRGDRHS